MSQIVTVDAIKKDRAGKGAARATRREGRVPAVIYGDKKEPTMISLDPRDVWRELQSGAFFTRLYEFNVDGENARTLARDVQFHPVTDQPMHLDFLRVGPDTMVTVDVPVRFLNETTCPGIKRGGLLNVVRHAVELLCKADSIPESLTFDLANTKMGETIHISAFELPEGVTPTITDRDFTVATIAIPSRLRGVADEEEEATEE